jgi:hypothetical protein
MAPPGRKRSKLSGSGTTAAEKSLPWQNVRNQDLLGTEYIEIDPLNKVDLDGEKPPAQIDFEFSTTKPILFGPMTKFVVEGTFEVKTADAGAIFLPATDAEVASVLLQYNWFEMLIKSVDVFHNNQRIASSNEQRFVSPYLHTMLYRYMSPDSKRYLCPQKAHPAYCIPLGRKDWKVTSQAWKDYAAHVFVGKSINFDFFPLFQWPFYLGSNFMTDPVSRLLPLDRLGKLHIRFTFFDKQDHIFRKAANVTKSYRFKIESFQMCLEEARLSPALERQFASRPKIEFPVVTRLQLVDPVPDSSSTHKTVFQDIYLPEAVLIFCLDKQVASGSYDFSAVTDQNVFKDHRILHLDLSFDKKKFCLKEPNFGKFRTDHLGLKQLIDHHMFPMLGVKPDVSQLLLGHILDGGEATPFPHIYIPLCSNFVDKERLVPSQDDGSCISRKGDLEIAFQFQVTNSQTSAVYVTYAIYTDVANILDLKNQRFSSPYLKWI